MKRETVKFGTNIQNNKAMKYAFIALCAVVFSSCFSPSQEQVDKAVQKELQRQEEEKKRIYSIIDDYIKERGGLPVKTAEDSGKPSIAEQLKKPKHVDLGESPIKGYSKAQVTIYEFSDFQCPFCQRSNSVLERLLQKYAGKVKLVYKFFPLAIHPDAKLAAQAAVAAQKQGKFWEMHDKMFDNQTSLKKENLLKYAEELHLDVAKFEKDMLLPKTVQRVELESKQGYALGLNSTPSFIINGVELVTPTSEQDFTKIIEIILKK